jgi:ubiquinol-cytochrome c reductase cytochrome c1 subunit
MKRLALAALAALTLGAAEAQAAEGVELAEQPWSFEGIFGHYDRPSMQRGLQVYQEVCAACHGLKFIAFRNLPDLGFTEDEAKAIAAKYEIEDGPNDDGDMFLRPGRLSDRFPSPFANDKQARASNNGALPPDLSLITKARVGGPNYLYGILTGYHEPPADFTVGEGMYYNAVMTGHQIAMPPPLSEGLITYADGTNATVEQMARDVTQFLSWAAEPKLEARKNAGAKTILILVFLAALAYASKRRIWAAVH